MHVVSGVCKGMLALMYRTVILGSGRGSNAEAILEAQDNGALGAARVVGIFSDQGQAPILELGPRYDIPAIYLNPGPYKTRFSADAERHWARTIDSLFPDLLVLAGFMRVLKAPLLEAFAGRIINLHPSLLPDFPGLHSIQRAFEAGVPETGCTVHWVDASVDGGEIIEQARVPVTADDTLESLEARVHRAEHELLPRVIRGLAEKARHDRAG